MTKLASRVVKRLIPISGAVALTLWYLTNAPVHAANLGEFESATDVGTVELPGSAEFLPDQARYRMQGSGANIRATEDAFQFLWKKTSGDLVFSMDVEWVGEGKMKHRKACAMVRQNLEADSPYVDVAVHGGGLIELQYRKEKGAITLGVRTPIAAPATVKLERDGDVFTVSVAKQGGPFQPVGAVSLALPDPVYVDLAVCSHDATVSETATPVMEPAGVRPRPNILWIMADQLRFDCVGANGNRMIKTPQLDRFAEQSANFSQAFVQSPVCVPSRASFFTGRYPHSHRNRVNYTPLASSEVLLPARLQTAGYRTAIVGKSHLYYDYPPTADAARRTGFDLVDLHDGVYFTDPWSAYAQWRQANDPLRDIPYRKLAQQVPQLRGDLPADANPYRAAIDERFTDTTWTGMQTRERLKELAVGEQPFFLFSSFWKPHGPYEVPVPFDAMYSDIEIPLPAPETLDTIGRLPLPLQQLILRGKRPPYDMDRTQLQWLYRSYYGTVSHLDREVGLILKTLQEFGADKNTIVVFTSDHGDQLLEHGLMGKNVFFEASIRIPLMIRFPDEIRPGRYDSLVESIDVLPTLFALAGLPEPENCQGRSLTPICSKSGGASAVRDAVFSENVIPEVITNGGLDFSFAKGEGIKGVRHPDAKMVRTQRWKYNYYPDGDAELYDLQNDSQEQHNLAADPDHQPIVEELRQRLLNWLITADEVDQIAPRWVLPK